MHDRSGYDSHPVVSGAFFIYHLTHSDDFVGAGLYITK